VVNARRVVLMAFALGATVACGSDLGPPLPDPGPSSGLDRGKLFVDLTRDEAGAFCDWMAGRFGGYGRGVTCADGSTLSARQSMALCVNDWATANKGCPLSVGDFEDCINGAVVKPQCPRVPPVCLGLALCLPP
jgi:hypothetical protein